MASRYPPPCSLGRVLLNVNRERGWRQAGMRFREPDQFVMRVGAEVSDHFIAAAVTRLGCDGSINPFPGFHPELIAEGPPE